MIETVFDVQSYVDNMGYGDHPLDEVVEHLTENAVTDYERDAKEIARHLWDEKLTDAQGREWRLKRIKRLVTEIVAINDWETEMSNQ